MEANSNMKLKKINADLNKNLIISDEENRFIIQKLNEQETFEIKKTKNITIINKMYCNSYIQNKDNNINKAYGILGILTTMNTDYLIVISEASFIGEILKSKIYRITKVVYLPFEKISSDLFEQETKYFTMYNVFIEKNHLYFSDLYDLTNNFHDNIFQSHINNESDSVNFLKKHFCWNYDELNNLKVALTVRNIENGKEKPIKESERNKKEKIERTQFSIIPPIINGYIEIKKIEEYEKEFVYILVARKDNRRTGMRFMCRGADEEGNCANFVETEQIILIYDKYHAYLGDVNYQVISHLQVRGSIPIRWNQPSNFNLVPKILLSDKFEEDLDIMKKHVLDMNKDYNSAIMINLIDKKGDQLKLGNLFNNIYNKIVFDFPEEQKPDFIWFDFHENCKKMKYENLNILISSPMFKKWLDEKQYYHLIIPAFYTSMKKFTEKNLTVKPISLISTQRGVFRTNCIDCLDRTNIVQTLISRHFTHQIMIKLNICSKKSYTGKVFDKFRKNFELHFKNLWSNHGDVISNSYAGTGAQKADFTRTGTRTYYGVLKDLLIGTKRFFVNNINDFYYQECQDYFLHRLSVKEMRVVQKPSDKILSSLTVLTLSYLIYLLSKMLKKMR